MDTNILTAIIGLVAGAGGYWFTTFWMKPILQYREIRSKVLADLIYYAQVVNADGLGQRMQELLSERIHANRRAAAELAACLYELPRWYLWWLNWIGQKPDVAATNLIGYSNTSDFDMAEKRVQIIRKSLGLPAEN